VSSSAPKRHVRLAVALVVASLLGTFAVYTAIAGDSTPVLGVAAAQASDHGAIKLVGTVVSTKGDAGSAAGMRFTLADALGKPARMVVVYHGAVPDAYRVGRSVVVDGRVRGGVFEAKADSLVTKCPSKYQDTPASTGVSQ
jgi:cytochrome c-type biogenesis protein CcmE